MKFAIPGISRNKLSLAMTAFVFVSLVVAASLRYDNFFSVREFSNLLRTNAYLGITAIGLTFVILSGGIDLSVGAVIGCTSIFLAVAMAVPTDAKPIGWGWHPAIAILLTLLLGSLLGLIQGLLIHFFQLQSFLITLGGLFFCRGLALVISHSDVAISNPWYARLTEMHSLWPDPVTHRAGMLVSNAELIFFVLFIFAIIVAALRPIGRYVYALGGNEHSAILMGLPIARTRVSVYAFSGFCAALAGVATTFDLGSGNALRGTGLELDAIAAVVVGGTLLSGGVGGVFGTLLGVLIFGVIKDAITFEGRDSYWSSITMGLLLLVFIVLQKLLQPRES